MNNFNFSVFWQYLYIKAIILFLFAFGIGNFAHAQVGDSAAIAQTKRNRIIGVSTIGAAAYAGTLVGLQYVRYNNYPTTNFYFANNNSHWKQVGKLGHFALGSKITINGYNLLRWVGVKHKNSLIYAAGTSMLYLSTLEVIDGYHSGLGFSWGDMAANAGGTAFTAIQLAVWKQQKFNYKFSYHQTQFSQYNPNTLGRGFWEYWMKDFNGQTHWISFSPWAFSKSERAPKWLCVAIGYGAEGMTGATENITEFNGKPAPQFDRYRQYYLSLDIDLSKIKTRYKFLKLVFGVLSNVKVPFPALEFNRINKVKGYGIYF